MPRNIFFVFMAVGIIFAVGPTFYYVSSWLRAAEGRGWPSTQGTILSVDVEDRTSRDSDGHTSYTHYPRIAYAYRVGNRALRGERIWLTGNDFYNDRDDAVAFVQDYQVGQTVPVLYDPQRPGQSTLLVENPPWQILLFTAFGLLWIAISMSFRFSGRSASRPRFGTCRSCGTQIPLQQPATAGSVSGYPICPRCGERNPIKARRYQPGMIVFIIAFAGIWAIGLYLMFFL